jgi:hypothetical protein
MILSNFSYSIIYQQRFIYCGPWNVVRKAWPSEKERELAAGAYHDSDSRSYAQGLTLCAQEVT